MFLSNHEYSRMLEQIYYLTEVNKVYQKDNYRLGSQIHELSQRLKTLQQINRTNDLRGQCHLQSKNQQSTIKYIENMQKKLQLLIKEKSEEHKQLLSEWTQKEKHPEKRNESERQRQADDEKSESAANLLNFIKQIRSNEKNLRRQEILQIARKNQIFQQQQSAHAFSRLDQNPKKSKREQGRKMGTSSNSHHNKQNMKRDFTLGKINQNMLPKQSEKNSKNFQPTSDKKNKKNEKSNKTKPKHEKTEGKENEDPQKKFRNEMLKLLVNFGTDSKNLGGGQEKKRETKPVPK